MHCFDIFPAQSSNIKTTSTSYWWEMCIVLDSIHEFSLRLKILDHWSLSCQSKEIHWNEMFIKSWIMSVFAVPLLFMCLIPSGCCIYCSSCSSGKNALHLASRNGHSLCVQKLLQVKRLSPVGQQLVSRGSVLRGIFKMQAQGRTDGEIGREHNGAWSFPRLA